MAACYEKKNFTVDIGGEGKNKNSEKINRLQLSLAFSFSGVFFCLFVYNGQTM